MNRILIFITAIFCASCVNRTNSAHPKQHSFQGLLEEADSLYDSGEFKKSGQRFFNAFRENPKDVAVEDWYFAACSWALAGYPDSAFLCLDSVAARRYTFYYSLATDTDLYTLYKDGRWKLFLNRIKQNKDVIESNLDTKLVDQLDTILKDDQGDRRQLERLLKKKGNYSDEISKVNQRILLKDSINLRKVRMILDERGWLGPKDVGQRGASALFLVIQHSDLATQEKYLPLLEEAVHKGNAKGSELALLVDRIEMRNNRPQIYGSQVIFSNGVNTVYKIKDEANVNKRRAAMGMEPLEKYLKYWGIDYKLPK